MNSVAPVVFFVLFSLISAADPQWGFGQCSFSNPSDSRNSLGFKCKSGMCIDCEKWRDQTCDCCGSDHNCTSCSDKSDEECPTGQISCDFGKCIGGSAATKNLTCQWDCVQTDLYSAKPQLYTECSTKRTPISGTLEELFTYCKRILSHPPMDCGDNCCQPCLNQTVSYCNTHQYLDIVDASGLITQPGKQPPCVLSCPSSYANAPKKSA